mmetsp:Transcript_581/g.1023  ORF Transcript_581/g.1023 Transcript_581/m.1023 type:complete len:300 (-) Transcript_581:176-1075(-)
MKSYSFCLATLVTLAIATTGVAFQCLNYDSNMGATYDLDDLHRSPNDPIYMVIDGDLPCTKKVEQNFTYIFNICGAVSTGVPQKCKALQGVESAGALQINTRGTFDASDDYCYLVGKYSESSTTVALLDQEDPSKGMELTYFGAYCDDGTQRQFKINLECADKLNPIPTHALEYSHCVYTITMPSVYGCPLECPVSHRHLCAGNGHCAYDDDKGAARCFCNQGYTGADCSKSESETALNYSPALLGLIITLFIIVCLLGAGLLFMVRQIAAYKDDIAHYEVLKGSEEESAHGAGGGVVV